MVVFQINTVVNKGSVGRIVQGIGDVLRSNGWESYIAYARYGGDSKSHLIKIGNYVDVLSHVLGTRCTDKHGLFSTIATKKLIRQIEVVDPDIIHIHNLHGYYINYKMFFEYLSQSKTPTVWTLHDCWPFTGHCVYFDFCKCNKWESACEHCPQTDTYPKSFYDNSKSNYCSKRHSFTSLENLVFVPVSNWLNGQLKKSFLKNYPSVVVRNGIDLQCFGSSDLIEIPNLQHKFVVLGVANVWEERKGLDDFLLLSEKLSEDVVIILIGLSKSQIKKCPSNVIGIFHTQNVLELTSYYSRADVFLNLTYEDNYPTTNLEAIACGTPVITYNTGGSPESVVEGNGYVVNKGNLIEVMECIQKVRKGDLPDKEKRKEYAKKYFDQEKCFMEYIEIYSSLIN